MRARGPGPGGPQRPIRRWARQQATTGSPAGTRRLADMPPNQKPRTNPEAGAPPPLDGVWGPGPYVPSMRPHQAPPP